MVDFSSGTPRKRLRLANYDYSQEGTFFITICVLNRELLLQPVYVHKMIEDAWLKIPEKFPGTELDEYVIMPNHIHGILHTVGAVLSEAHVGPSSPHPSSEKLPRILQWFKTVTTTAFLRGIKNHNWPPFTGKLWQRSYHERIIRDERELDALRKYIIDNPANWERDENNPIVIAGREVRVRA